MKITKSCGLVSCNQEAELICRISNELEKKKRGKLKRKSKTSVIIPNKNKRRYTRNISLLERGKNNEYN